MKLGENWFRTLSSMKRSQYDIQRAVESLQRIFPWGQFDQVCVLERPLWLQCGRHIGDQADVGLWVPVRCLDYESGSRVQRNVQAV